MLVSQDNTMSELLLSDGLFSQETFAAGAANTYPAGLILARNTTNDKLEVYVSGGPNGTGTPAFVLTNELVTTGAGDTVLRALVSGIIREDKLLVWNAGTPAAPSKAEGDQLRDFTIVSQPDTELLKFDNS